MAQLGHLCAPKSPLCANRMSGCLARVVIAVQPSHCTAIVHCTFPDHGKLIITLTTTTCILSQTPMATSHSNYQSIFNAALVSYKKRTGKDLPAILASDPLLRRLEICHSPDDVFAILRGPILWSGQSRSNNGKLTKWLDPTVNVLYTLSITVGAGLVSCSVNLGSTI